MPPAPARGSAATRGQRPCTCSAVLPLVLCPHRVVHQPALHSGPSLPQEEAPEALQRNSAFQALQAHVRSMTDKHHSVPPAAGAAPKEWVRGWTDKGEELAPKSG